MTLGERFWRIEGGRVMDAFEEYKQVTHGMSEEGFVAYPLVQAVIEELMGDEDGD